MNILILLLLVSVGLAAGFLIAFLWAVRSGQMDDKYTPSVRMLFDDEKVEDRKSAEEQKQKKEEEQTEIKE